jgi:hypothetical protein
MHLDTQPEGEVERIGQRLSFHNELRYYAPIIGASLLIDDQQIDKGLSSLRSTSG